MKVDCDKQLKLMEIALAKDKATKDKKRRRKKEKKDKLRLERELNKKDSFYSCTHIFCSCIYIEIFCFSTKCLRNWCCCALEYFSVKVTKIFSSIRDKKVCSKEWTTCCQSSTKEEVKVTKFAGELSVTVARLQS